MSLLKVTFDWSLHSFLVQIPYNCALEFPVQLWRMSCTLFLPFFWGWQSSVILSCRNGVITKIIMPQSLMRNNVVYIIWKNKISFTNEHLTLRLRESGSWNLHRKNLCPHKFDDFFPCTHCLSHGQRIIFQIPMAQLSLILLCQYSKWPTHLWLWLFKVELN